jgi:hypothetical protein
MSHKKSWSRVKDHKAVEKTMERIFGYDRRKKEAAERAAAETPPAQQSEPVKIQDANLFPFLKLP